MSASLHKWMAKKGGVGVTAPTNQAPAGTIPAGAVAGPGTMPVFLASLPLPAAPKGQASGGGVGSPVPVTVTSEVAAGPGTMPVSLAPRPLPAAPQGQAGGGDVGSPVPVTVLSEAIVSEAVPPT